MSENFFAPQSINAYYIKYREAAALLRERAPLQREVAAWWAEKGWTKSPMLSAQPSACFERHVSTFRYEDALFYLLAREAGLSPIWLQYISDKFVSISKPKRKLLQRNVCIGRGRSGGAHTVEETLADINEYDGKPLSSVMVGKHTTLIDFHNAHQSRMIDRPRRVDLSPWIKQFSGVKEFYIAKISCYISHAVLFEDYHGGEEEGGDLNDFHDNVFEPAFRTVYERFGVKPLIVRMPWWHELGYYPADTNWRNHGIIPKNFARYYRLSGN